MSNLQLGYSGIDLVSQGTGYGMLIGLGVFFCGVILVAIKIQKVYLSEDSGTSEMFMVANRSVGTGLTAAAVFSSWMWINETVRYSLTPSIFAADFWFWSSPHLCVIASDWRFLCGGEAVSAFRYL